jgi:predicted neuraminidase
MVLPVHFELGIKFPAALRFDDQGRFQGMVRLSQLKHLLQPTLLPQTTQHWIALMRDTRSAGKIGMVQTLDGGKHWSDLPNLPLDNPDAAVAGMALAPGDLLLAHNASVSGRAQLDLSHSTDGLNWTLLHTLEQGAPHEEFSYPSMVWVDGSLWLSYTVDRQKLAWQRFAPQVKHPRAKP